MPARTASRQQKWPRSEIRGKCIHVADMIAPIDLGSVLDVERHLWWEWAESRKDGLAQCWIAHTRNSF
ncbi:MAG TPA: hypothetical protein VFX76_06915 [Roseiflexaceae bacterium]|nr:hypothetical protein [Roseiflexaceae bacterium]